MKELTVKEERFIYDHCILGLTLCEAWRRYKPDSKQSDELARRSGWKVLQRIKAKAENWQELFERMDAGVAAVINIFRAAITATKQQEVYNEKGERVTIEVVDHVARLRAAKELAEIHGLKNTVINVKVDEPLPLIIRYPDGFNDGTIRTQ